MDLNELKNFDISDFSRLGNAPMAIKATLSLVVFAMVLATGYYLHTRSQLNQLDTLKAKETELKNQLERKFQQSSNISVYKNQLNDMNNEFGAMLQQLPSSTEIPEVILDISQTGLASGLKIELFKPQHEIDKGFYAEKPIQIRVAGSYHQMARFSSGIAALPRIVTLHDIKIIPTQKEQLVMDVTAKIYRYLATDQEQAEKE